MIVTRQKHVPWLWVVLSHLPWAAMLFASAVTTIVFTLEVRKFTANPAAIATVLTVTGIVTMFIEPFINFISDRIWTRFGRRKIFYVPAILGQATLILFIPLAPGLGALVTMMVAHLILISASKPKESLVQEIVPNHQRGRASVLHSIFVNIGLFSYNIALIGRFDDLFLDHPLEGIFDYLTGESLMFFVFSAALLSIVLIVGLGVKEIRPPRITSVREDLGGKITPWRFIKRFFVDCFSSEWWPIYLLALSQVLYGLKLGGMVALMYTDQWGYSTQALGTNQAIVQLISVGAIAFAATFIDRWDRMLTYGGIVVLGMGLKIFWYCYVMFLVPDQRPELWEILVFGETIGIVGMFVGVVTYPLVYEFVPIDKMGTANAGLGLFRGVMGMILGPLMGFWIGWWSIWFLPAAGSTAVAVLDDEVTEAEMTQMVDQWEQEVAAQDSERSLEEVTYYAEMLVPYGTELAASRQWSFREKDPEAETIREKITELDQELTDVQRDIDTELMYADEASPELVEKKEELQTRIDERKAALDSRAQAFREFLRSKLGDRLARGEGTLRNLEFDGERVSMTSRIAYPATRSNFKHMAKELKVNLELEGWRSVEVAQIAGGEKWLLGGDFGQGDEAEDKAEAAWQTISEAEAQSEGPLLQIAATKSELVEQIDPAERDLYRDAVSGYFARTDAEATDLEKKRAASLLESVAEVAVGYRTNLEFPFPDIGYQPQKYDYFSSYLLMIITDVIAIGLILMLLRMEKQGRIHRLGAMEDPHSQQKKKA
ncbi:MAG: MFS transporter [Phycisphaeraceae bacterium]